MAKNFKGNNPLDKMDSKNPVQVEKENKPIEESNPEPAAETNETPAVKPTKKKTGRPKVKMGEYKTINIAVPIPMLAQMEIAKLKYGNNLTAYVNAVIKADLDVNFKKYQQLQEIMNS